MPKVLDITGMEVFSGKSDAECVRWWRREGCETDQLDTGEFMQQVDDILGLD